MAKQFVVVDVGCIACRESTRVLGVYHGKAAADEALQAARTSFITDYAGNYFAGGHHNIGLYEVSLVGDVAS